MTDDYAFYREQTIKLIRQDGMNQARLDGHDEAIVRIEKTVTDGFAAQKVASETQANHLRGEMKSGFDAVERRRGEDMESIADQFSAINRQFEAGHASAAANRRLLLRVAWAGLVLATALAAASTGAQVALTEPRIAAVASTLQQALGQ